MIRRIFRFWIGPRPTGTGRHRATPARPGYQMWREHPRAAATNPPPSAPTGRDDEPDWTPWGSNTLRVGGYIQAVE